MSELLDNRNVWISWVKRIVKGFGASLGMLLRICWWSIGALISTCISLLLVTITVMALKPVSVWSYIVTGVLLLIAGLIPGAIAGLFQSTAFRSVGFVGRWGWFCTVTVSSALGLSTGTVAGELLWSSTPGSEGMVTGTALGLVTWGVVQAIIPSYLLHLAGVEKSWRYAALTVVGALLLVGSYVALYGAIGAVYSLLLGAFVYSALQVLMLEYLLRPIMRYLQES